MQKKISYLDLFKEIANEQFDGHYTIMKFTTNYRVAFGTIMANDYCELREVIQGMAEGKTLEEACKRCVEEGTSLYNIPLGDGGNW